MDRCPVSSIIARDLALHPSRRLHYPKRLLAKLDLRPIRMMLHHRQAETAPIKLYRAIHVVNIDADLEFHRAPPEITNCDFKQFCPPSGCPTTPREGLGGRPFRFPLPSREGG